MLRLRYTSIFVANLLYNKLYNKSTTNRSNGVWALVDRWQSSLSHWASTFVELCQHVDDRCAVANFLSPEFETKFYMGVQCILVFFFLNTRIFLHILCSTRLLRAETALDSLSHFDRTLDTDTDGVTDTRPQLASRMWNYSSCLGID